MLDECNLPLEIIEFIHVLATINNSDKRTAFFKRFLVPKEMKNGEIQLRKIFPFHKSMRTVTEIFPERDKFQSTIASCAKRMAYYNKDAELLSFVIMDDKTVWPDALKTAQNLLQDKPTRLAEPKSTDILINDLKYAVSTSSILTQVLLQHCQAYSKFRNQPVFTSVISTISIPNQSSPGTPTLHEALFGNFSSTADLPPETLLDFSIRNQNWHSFIILIEMGVQRVPKPPQFIRIPAAVISWFEFCCKSDDLLLFQKYRNIIAQTLVGLQEEKHVFDRVMTVAINSNAVKLAGYLATAQAIMPTVNDLINLYMVQPLDKKDHISPHPPQHRPHQQVGDEPVDTDTTINANRKNEIENDDFDSFDDDDDAIFAIFLDKLLVSYPQLKSSVVMRTVSSVSSAFSEVKSTSAISSPAQITTSPSLESVLDPDQPLDVQSSPSLHPQLAPPSTLAPTIPLITHHASTLLQSSLPVTSPTSTPNTPPTASPQCNIKKNTSASCKPILCPLSTAFENGLSHVAHVLYNHGAAFGPNHVYNVPKLLDLGLPAMIEAGWFSGEGSEENETGKTPRIHSVPVENTHHFFLQRTMGVIPAPHRFSQINAQYPIDVTPWQHCEDCSGPATPLQIKTTLVIRAIINLDLPLLEALCTITNPRPNLTIPLYNCEHKPRLLTPLTGNSINVSRIPHRLTPIMIATLRLDSDVLAAIHHRERRTVAYEQRQRHLKHIYPLWNMPGVSQHHEYNEAILQTVPIPTSLPNNQNPNTNRNPGGQNRSGNASGNILTVDPWSEKTQTPLFLEILIGTYIESILDDLVDVEQIPIPGSQLYQKKGEVLKRKKKRDRFFY